LGPDGRNTRIKSFLEAKNNSVIVTAGDVDLAFLEQNAIDLVISSGYAPIIKEPVVSAYEGRIINLHISYLPNGRGMYPNFWSFFESTPKGVSIHFIDPGIDTGAILFQWKVPFTANETLQTSHTKLMSALENLFFEKWEDISSQNLRPIGQASLNAQVRYHSKVETERFMDLLPQIWDTPAAVVEQMGAEMSVSRQFWQRYDSEVLDSRHRAELDELSSAR
jgi:methionyl-tRNA formyltransferase